MKRRNILHFPGSFGRVFLAAAVIALLSPALASGARVAVFDDPAFVEALAELVRARSAAWLTGAPVA